MAASRGTAAPGRCIVFVEENAPAAARLEQAIDCLPLQSIALPASPVSGHAPTAEISSPARTSLHHLGKIAQSCHLGRR